jgi:hypothetical protein
MVASIAWTMWCFYGVNYVSAYACFSCTSKLASMIHLWANIRCISFPVTNSSQFFGWTGNSYDKTTAYRPRSCSALTRHQGETQGPRRP